MATTEINPHGISPNEICMIEHLQPLFGDFVRSAEIFPKIRFAKVQTFKRRFGISSDILEPIDNLYQSGYEFVLAGGKMIDFVCNLSRAESLGDYDLWCLTESQLDSLTKSAFAKKVNLKRILDKPHVVEYVNPSGRTEIQVIRQLYTNVDEILNIFDFRACGIAYDGQYIYWLEGALKDIKDKKLVMQCIHPKPAVAHRVQKYIRKGYTMSNVDFGLAAVAFLESMLVDRGADNSVFQRAFTDRNLSVQDAQIIAQAGYNRTLVP